MRKRNVRPIAAILCLAVAFLLTLGVSLFSAVFPLDERFTSVHPSATVPPLMGFATDSVMNTGDAKALDNFPGIGEVISQRIIDLRAVVDGYQIPEDLLLVKGIGPKTLDKMMNVLDESLVEVPVTVE